MTLIGRVVEPESINRLFLLTRQYANRVGASNGFLERSRIPYISFDEANVRDRRQIRQRPRRQVVEHGRFVTFVDENFYNVRADESGPSRYQCLHCRRRNVATFSGDMWTHFVPASHTAD